MLLWGLKTEAAFDLWSLEHLANGIAMAAAAQFILRSLVKNKIPEAQRVFFSLTLVIAAALFWENAEHYIEAGLLSGAWGERVTFWFAGIEHWTNRLLGDNLMIFFGWLIYTKKPRFAFAAKLFSTVWLLLHILVFPDSMYLQRLISP
ncbi:MAG: hypothetical protein LBG76_11420 [Treponema sp.]|jgi:hypothetical protein|nr:hypothetical protein [Treponema sp.]